VESEAADGNIGGFLPRGPLGGDRSPNPVT